MQTRAVPAPPRCRAAVGCPWPPVVRREPHDTPLASALVPPAGARYLPPRGPGGSRRQPRYPTAGPRRLALYPLAGVESHAAGPLPGPGALPLDCLHAPPAALATTTALPPPTAPSTPAPAPAARVYAFTTRIPFAWDSAQLAPAAYHLLDTLADVLQDAQLADKVMRIEGHTDSAGADAYNRRLSYRRAVAVQQYLVAAHGLPRSRLPVVGKGKAELSDPAHPLDPSNRRVEFVNLTDSAPRP